jgi:hypothetical protein
VSEIPSNGSHADDDELAARLAAERALPTPAFRGGLGRLLSSLDPGYGHRPEDLWRAVGLFGVAAVILVLVGLLQSVGVL